MPLESQSIAWPSGADHADEIASRSLPESLNRLKCQFWETYFNWKRRRLEDNHNNIQEPVSNAFQCPWYSIVALPAHCEVKNIEQHGGRALEFTQTLGAALDIPQGEGRVVKFDDTVEHADWYAMAVSINAFVFNCLPYEFGGILTSIFSCDRIFHRCNHLANHCQYLSYLHFWDSLQYYLY